MIRIGYHGTNQKIETYNLDHLGENQGQTLFPGIYFASSYRVAKDQAELAAMKRGGKPIVYIAECELEKPITSSNTSGIRIFHSYSDIENFAKEYFPDWFRGNGILSYKADYLRGKFETYQGQYDFIKYAASENNLPLIEVFNRLGLDSYSDPHEFVITSPQQILSFEVADHEYSREELNEFKLPAEEEMANGSPSTIDFFMSAYEAKSNDYVRASKGGKPYSSIPGNRFTRRVRIRMNGGNNVWFDIDINRIFKKGSFAIKIPVIGETDQYVSMISFDEWLPKLKNDILSTGFNQITVKRSLMEMLRFHDLRVRCTCPDFRYRHSYWLTVHNEIEGDPELRPSDKTNPRDDLGKICKHLAFIINNKVWGDKESRIIYNYLINLQRSQKALFDRIVAPKLGLDILKQREEEELAKQQQPQPDQVEQELESSPELRDRVVDKQPMNQVQETGEEVPEDDVEQ